MVHGKMGMKFLSLQMIPWCFHVLGRTCQAGGGHEEIDDSAPTKGATAVGTVKLIRSDGKVKIYHRPVNASELMVEFPKHLICRSDSFTIGQKIPALSEHEELQLGNSYFLLPTHFFQSVLSFVNLAASFARAFGAGNSNKRAAAALPFDIHRTPSGTLQIRVSDEFIEKIRRDQGGEAGEEESGGGGSRVCTTAALEKDYKQLVRCKEARQWKPRLETIRESQRRRLVGSGVFGGIKRRRKNQTQACPPPPPPFYSISRDQWKLKNGL